MAPPSRPARHGSSAKYSKLRPHSGERLMLTPGPEHDVDVVRRGLRADRGAHLRDERGIPARRERGCRGEAGGRQAGAGETLPACLRSPCGPSDTMTDSRPASGTDAVCQ